MSKRVLIIGPTLRSKLKLLLKPTLFWPALEVDWSRHPLSPPETHLLSCYDDEQKVYDVSTMSVSAMPLLLWAWLWWVLSILGKKEGLGLHPRALEYL